MACSFDDHTLKLFDATTEEYVRTFEGHSHYVTTFSFSPDGQRILSASCDETLKLWDVATAECLRTFHGHVYTILTCCFSPDGQRIVSAAQDQTIKLWDALTGECLRTTKAHANGIAECGFSPDGMSIVTGSNDAEVKLWDATSGRPIRSLTGHSSRITSCRFSPDGRWIISSSDHLVKIWDRSTGECLRNFQGSFGPDPAVSIHCGFASVDQNIIFGSCLGTVILWNAETGEMIHSILSVSSDNTIRSWEAATGVCLLNFTAHNHAVRSCNFSFDGDYIISGSDDNTVKVWDASSGDCQITLVNGPTGEEAAIDLLNNDVRWAGNEAWRLLRWRATDKETGKPIVLPAEHFGPLPTTSIQRQ